MFLLALPLEIPGYWRRFAAADVPTAIVHGWHDELCPVDAAIDFARAHGATLHLVHDDHRLGAARRLLRGAVPPLPAGSRLT